MLSALDKEMHEFCKHTRGRKCRFEVEVSFQHWVPYPANPFTVTLECERSAVTLRTTGTGATLLEALRMAQKRIYEALEPQTGERRRRNTYTVDLDGRTLGVGANTQGLDTANYKEESHSNTPDSAASTPPLL